MRSVIKSVVNTEKSTRANEKGVYVFVVDREANKFQIKSEVKHRWNVEVKSVNTVNVLGKSKTRYSKSGVVAGRTQSFKKAYVTLKEGQTIDLYEGIE